jgi:hypothetical protein
VNPLILALAVPFAAPIDRGADLRPFPAVHVAKEQRIEAEKRCSRAYIAWMDAPNLRNERIWREVHIRTAYAQDVWRALEQAHQARTAKERKIQLDYLQKRLGWPDYMAGQMPMPVYVPPQSKLPVVKIAGK